MEKSGLVNYILLIRLVIYALIFLIITVLNIVFDGPTQKELLLNMALAVSFFSIFSFIANKVFKPLFAFYIQPVFDTILLTVLVFSTGFINSPFVIFFSIIFFYMGFLDGKRGGIAQLLILIITFFVFHILLDGQFDYHLTGYKTYDLIAQYSAAFVIIVILSSYLHTSYKTKTAEKDYIEERFASLKLLHDNILQNINIGIILLNDSNTILSCNREGVNIFELIENKIIGRKIVDLFDFTNVENGVARFNDKFIGFRYQKFISDYNNIKGRLFIFQDVTEKEKLKEELAKKQKLADLGQFSSVIAHEIKNPLGAIKGSFQLVKKKIQIPNKLINIIDREMNRLDLVLNNLLYVSKPASKEDLNVELKHAIEEFLELMDSHEMFEEINCNVNIENNSTVIISNHEMKQILWNLFINTYEIRNDATVDINFVVENNLTVLKYSDNGAGISSHILEDVIQPFFTTKRTGTGLGLHVIRIICEKYNIKFKIYSNEEVEGFRIDFIFQNK